MYPYYTVIWWVFLIALVVSTVAINESIYPSTYIFGGPDKVLMLSTENMTSTDDIHYYHDCRCIDGAQVMKAAFTEDDHDAQDTSYDIRALLFVIIGAILLKMCLELSGIRPVFDLGVKRCTIVVDVVYMCMAFVALFSCVGSILIFDKQSFADCNQVEECTHESAWNRYTFSLLTLVGTTLLFVTFIITSFKDPFIGKDVSCCHGNCGKKCGKNKHVYTAVPFYADSSTNNTFQCKQAVQF